MALSSAPKGDGPFDQWVDNFNTALAAHYAAVGLASDDVSLLDAATLMWDGKYGAHLAAQVAGREATAGKNEARASLEDTLRPMIARIQSYPGTTDELRQAFGLKPRATSSGAELPVEAQPIAHLDINNKLEHKLVIRTLTATGETKFKPAGTMGCEVYRKVGDTPAGPSDMQLLMLTAKSTLTLTYSEADGGKKAHYMMRYVSPDGEPGPWSMLQSATIAA